MKKTITKTLSVLLAAIMVLSLLPVTEFVPTANAADLYDVEIYSKIQEQKQLFKQGEYFAGNYTTGMNLTKSSPTRVCSCGKYCGKCNCNCGTYYSGGSRRSYQCYAFACQIATNVFGVDMYRFTGANNINKHRDVNKLKVGDIVYFSWNGSAESPHAIFVTDIVGDTVYYGDNNASGPCQINWNNTMTKTRLQQLVNNNHSEQFYIYSAINNKYGEHTHSYGSNYLCKTCGAVKPSKVTSMSDTTYIVTTTNAKTRKGPYETCDKVRDIAKDTIITVNGKMTNTKDNLWYRLTDGSWIYSEHIKKYSITYADIADGTYRLKNVATGKYLIVDSGNGVNGRNVSVWALVESNTEQKWNLIEDSLGFKIHTCLSSGRVLNSYGDAVKPGNNVNIWNFIGGDATQRWKFQKVSGGYVIRNVSVPACVVSVGNGDDNVSVQTFSSGDKKQIWILEPVNGCSHSYDSGVITTLPSCTSSGVKTYSCTKCGSSYTSSVSAKGHSYVSETIKSATCTETGTKKYTCTACDSTKTESIAAKGHSYSSTITKEATCTETGTKKYTCTACYSTKTETIAAKGHSEVYFSETPATCTENGYTAGTKCSTCDTILSGGEVIYATGHSYDDGNIKVEPGCTSVGFKIYTCSKCNGTKVEKLAAKGHKEETFDGREATCTESGWKAGSKCAVCDEVLSGNEVLEPTGHNYVIQENIPATCYQYGESFEKCTKCGDRKDTFAIKPKAHTDNDKNGFCDICYININSESKVKLSLAENTDDYIIINIMTENAADFYSCNLKIDYDSELFSYKSVTYGYDFKRLLDSNAAIFALSDSGLGEIAIGIAMQRDFAINESVVLLQIRLDKIKTSDLIDIELSGSFSDTLFASFHKSVSFSGKEPTCTESGYTAGTKCETCGEILSGKQTLAATGHSYDSGKVTKEATCTEAGIKSFTCTKCKAEKTETIAATGHKAVTVNEKAATCTENGYTSGTKCSVCNETLSGMTNIPALGHRMVLDKATNELNCEVCGESGGAIGLPEIDVDVQLGDVDEDGKITAADARLALRASVGLENLNEPKTYAADVDKNGNVTAADARLILRCSVGLEKW